MRKLYIFGALVLLLGLVPNAPAFAGGSSSPRSTAHGGDAEAFGLGVGVGAAGVFDSGNSSNQIGIGNGHGSDFSPSSTSSATAFGGSAHQGQQQGLIGIQGQLGILDNEVDNANNQSQTSVGEVKVQDNSETSLTVEGDDVVYEAPDIPVNSAAPVFAGACSQGVSVQTHSFGGSAGTTNPVCDYVAVAGGFVAAGERDEAVRVLGKAEGAADWRYRLSQIRSVLTLGLL